VTLRARSWRSGTERRRLFRSARRVYVVEAPPSRMWSRDRGDRTRSPAAWAPRPGPSHVASDAPLAEPIAVAHAVVVRSVDHAEPSCAGRLQRRRRRRTVGTLAIRTAHEFAPRQATVPHLVRCECEFERSGQKSARREEKLEASPLTETSSDAECGRAVWGAQTSPQTNAACARSTLRPKRRFALPSRPRDADILSRRARSSAVCSSRTAYCCRR